ncbi:MAG: RecQ family ATP-dependent DNA helicase [Gemmatimonadetes bacterium]|nr:RecQ family ATP-dependent DNA helicase [Gemmatimonadota bacterium]
MPTLQDARHALRAFFGYGDFRGAQEAAITAVLAGRDVLVVMPTGGGKSICYQVPAAVLAGVTLVVSPLISLMKDQVDALAAVKLPATFINSSITASEIRHRLAAARRGDVKLLYVAPERFDSAQFRDALRELEVALLAVDEAHCISIWGHDFRPSYLRLGAVRAAFACPAIALTATATPRVRRDIVRYLRLRRPAQLVRGFDRRNLRWYVAAPRDEAEKAALLERLVRETSGSGIVYAATRKSVETVRRRLARLGIAVDAYHAGLADADRERVQEAFMAGTTRVVVATNAFGMGIDKPDVRLVVHYQTAGSLEAYYQEAGRAGRDGMPADCVLLHRYADRFTHEFLIDQSFPEPELVKRGHRALHEAAGPDGFLAAAPRALLGAVVGIGTARRADPVLRVLERAGAVRRHPPGARGPARVRLLALPERIRAELAGGDAEAELAFLRGLWKAAGGHALYRGTELQGSVLGALAGSFERARHLMEQLARRSFLEWIPPTPLRAWQVVLAPGRERIDWARESARRHAELEKLQRMQAYAYTPGCRRAHILRYFGDPAAMSRCDGCDNCLGGARAILPDVPTPAARSLAAPRRRRLSLRSPRA